MMPQSTSVPGERHVFVYGTLLAGEERGHVLDACERRQATITGQLFIGSNAQLQKASFAQLETVVGQLYIYNNVQLQEASLDTQWETLPNLLLGGT